MPWPKNPRSQQVHQPHPARASKPSTSWKGVAPWYNQLVGSQGHYYHQHVVIPGVLRLLNLQPSSSLIDLGCGQGVLARQIPEIAKYLGVDIAAPLIADAKKTNQNEKYNFQVQDVTKLQPNLKPSFTHAAIILALQNMNRPEVAILNAAHYLLPGGELVIVLNHPCFRIPRQSGWGIDDKSHQQYRWINRYLQPLKIPITMNPGHQQSPVTWSFHHSLQDYSQMLFAAGLVVTNIEEWISDKASVGEAARMENRARDEFPLFLTLKAQLLNAA